MNKMEDLRSMIADNVPDIIMITEVIPKAQKHPIQEPLLNLPGFEKFTNFKFTEDNLGASGKRGVVIYVSKKLHTESVLLQAKYDDHVWVRIKLRNNDSFLCGCIYRSPSKENGKANETAVERKDTHLLICGDFNYPEIDWSCEFVQLDSVKPFIRTIQEYHLHQHVCKPTRYREGQEPSLLDLVVSIEEGMVHNILHFPGLGDSDHECLRFDLSCYKDDSKEASQPDYNKARYEIIRERLRDIDWPSKLRGSFLEAYSCFESELSGATVGCIPEKVKRKAKKNIYLTTEAIRMKDRKNKLWRRYKRTRSHYDHARFKQAKNQLRSLTRRLRRNFENEIARDAKSFPKKFWSYVKSRTKTRSKIPILRRKDGTKASTPEEKAEALNEFFASVFTDERLENIPDDSFEFLGNYLRNFGISEEDVRKKLDKLNAGKTPGPDKWHPLLNS